MLGHSLAILRPTWCWVSPRKILGAGAKNRTEIVQVTRTEIVQVTRTEIVQVAAQPQPTKKWAGAEAGRIMDDILTPIPIDLHLNSG